jgi:hypothetical protein
MDSSVIGHKYETWVAHDMLFIDSTLAGDRRYAELQGANHLLVG